MEGTENETPSSTNKMLIPVVVVIALLVLGGVAVMVMNKGGQSKNVQIAPVQSVQTSPTEAMQKTTVTPSGAAPSGEAMTDKNAKTFTVTGSNFAFSPAEIRVKKGDTVKVTFTSSGGIHDFVIDELNVKTNRVASGQSETVTFTANKVGTFEYYCSVGSHRVMGMVGKLVVE